MLQSYAESMQHALHGNQLNGEGLITHDNVLLLKATYSTNLRAVSLKWPVE